MSPAAFCSFAHNVAEGIVVAVPVFAGTGDRRLALTLTVLSVRVIGALARAMYITGVRLRAFYQANDSRNCECVLLQGLSEPIGALLGVLFMKSWFAGVMEAAINATLCGVAGIMLAVSFQELLPQAIKFHADTRHAVLWFAIGGLAIGLTVMLL